MTSIIDAAQEELGKPYVWGAAGPGSFDCSGLVQWVYGLAGIKVPRTSREQKKAGTIISLSQAQPGDLVLYSYPGQADNPPPANHVGIYAGPGMMIDAPHSGADVRYDPIDTAHLDSVVHISGSAGSAGVAENAAYQQSLASNAGWTDFLDPGSWPGIAFAPLGGIFSGISSAIGSVARDVVVAIFTALGPVILETLSMIAAAALIMLGLWRMTEKPRAKVADTAQKAAVLAAAA